MSVDLQEFDHSLDRCNQRTVSVFVYQNTDLKMRNMVSLQIRIETYRAVAADSSEETNSKSSERSTCMPSIALETKRRAREMSLFVRSFSV